MSEQRSSVTEATTFPESGNGVDETMVSMLKPDGTRVSGGLCEEFAADLDAPKLQSLYRDMVLQRRFDLEATALQRKGELGLWAQSLGQEAAQVALGRAMRTQDFVFPTYREHGVAMTRGLTPADILPIFRGTSHGGWDPQRCNVHNYEIIIGAQTLHAVGHAMGVQLEGSIATGNSESDVVTVGCFGDGATSEGDVSEAFTFAGAFNAPVLFYCQNNQWAISEPTTVQTSVPLHRRGEGFGIRGIRVDGNDIIASYAVTRYCLEQIRAGHGPLLIEAFTYRMGAHTTADDPTKYRTGAEDEVWRAKDPIDRLRRHLIDELGIGTSFFSDIDAELEEFGAEVRRICNDMPDPSHETMFDHAYATRHPLVEEERAWYAEYLSSFDDAEEQKMTESMTMAKAINSGLREAMQNDSKVLLMGEDIGKLGGVFRITDGLQNDFGEQRVIDSPLAESGIVGTGIGMSIRGFRPVLEMQFDSFVFPAYDQIVNQLAKLHNRTAGQQTTPLVIRIPYGGGIGSPEHHSESPEAVFGHHSGIRLFAPSNPHDAYWSIQEAIACDDPVIHFEPKRRYWMKGEVDTSSSGIESERAAVLTPGTDVTLVTYGPLVPTAQEAVVAAASEGISIELVVLRSLNPIDFDAVVESVKRTQRLVVAHEAPIFLGLGGEIAARISERAFYHLEAPAIRVGAFHTPYPASKVEHHYLPDLDRLLDGVDRALAY